jgi:hypothetical protein
MDELDREIQETLNAEDRALLERLGEQGLFRQWFGVYEGGVRGIAVFATILAFGLTFAAAYCGWRFASAAHALEAARWGAAAGLLAIMVGFLKLWFWLRMESNRVLRELKRLELQIARRTAH